MYQTNLEVPSQKEDIPDLYLKLKKNGFPLNFFDAQNNVVGQMLGEDGLKISFIYGPAITQVSVTTPVDPRKTSQKILNIIEQSLKDSQEEKETRKEKNHLFCLKIYF